MRLTNYTKYQEFDADTELTEEQVNYYADICSEIIENYLDRSLAQATVNEYHKTDDDNTIILDQWPVSKVYIALTNWAIYCNISLDGGDNIPIQIQNDLTYINIDYGLSGTSNQITIADYATINLLANAIKTDIETETSYTATITYNGFYEDVNPIYLADGYYNLLGKNYNVDLVGLDLHSSVRYTLEGDRQLIVNKILPLNSNKVYVRYQYGYADVDALPVSIIDVCNRMIKDLQDSDANNDSLKTKYNKEKLDDAEYFKYDRDSAINDSYGYGILDKYKGQLDRYRRKDCGYY